MRDTQQPMTLEGVTAAWQKASAALGDSERRYRELVEYSLGLICTHDLTGTILSINPAAANSLGYRPDDGVGHNLRDFLSVDTRHLFDDYLRRIQEQGHDAGLMRVVARSGNERVWMYRNVLSQGSGGAYVLGHAIDVTERLEAERARSRQRALIEQRDTLAFLANFSDRLAPIVTFDDLIDVVRRLPVPFLADWTMVHVVDDDGSIRVVPDVHADPNLRPLLESSLSHVVDTARIAFLSLTPTQTSSAKAAALVPLVVDGVVKGVLSLLSATEHRFASSASMVVEEVARRIGLALDRIHLYRDAQEANRLKDEFLSTLSHELRTPLNAIFGWARILRSRTLDDRTAHAVEVIERNAEAQVRLIDEVLDVSRIITGKMTLAMEPVDAGAILRATVDAVRPAMHAKRIRLDQRIGDTVLVLGDSHRLQQVFWNVLSNALKFTGSDGAITVKLRRSNGSAVFSFADTGVGIRRDVLPFVFDRFRQADSSTTRRYGGLGLGLAIVKHIVELHGGNVYAASSGEGHGATFTIHLPIIESDHSSTRPMAATRPHATDQPMALRGRTILVVEDHDDARELIAGVLEGAGARVLCASTAQEAVEQAAAVRPDALVTDLGLPDEDGYALLAKIRETNPDLPALALTAYARATDRDRALAAGFQQHVIKPVDPQQLLELIAALL